MKRLLILVLIAGCTLSALAFDTDSCMLAATQGTHAGVRKQEKKAESQGALQAGDFFVSPKGSDRWSGTLPEPNAAGTDGPLARLLEIPLSFPVCEHWHALPVWQPTCKSQYRRPEHSMCSRQSALKSTIAS